MAKLAAYAAKRDFDRTAEPKGGDAAGGGDAFVIQKHDASRLHYDLRLELDGVMKSWAVAKGPSLVPGEKRLAVHVEDHPIEYNTFEGTIPKGQYGGGTVLIWDRGRWEPEGDPHKSYAKGHLDFRLHGEKLRGAFHLVRMRPKPREKQEAWLLIKSDDEGARPTDAPDILEEAPLSVVSGRDLDEIAADGSGAVWNSNRGLAAEKRASGRESPKGRSASPSPLRGGSSRSAAKAGAGVEQEGPAEVQSAPPPPGSASGRVRPPRKGEGDAAPMPREVEPCLAALVAKVPTGDGWLHEIKWDGYRLVAFKSGGDVRLATRNGHDWTARFPAIAEAVAAFPAERAILDGEAVIEDERGVSSFSALQAALSDEGGRIAREAVFYAFDLLFVEGEDLRPLPLDARKRRLAELLPPGGAGPLRLSEHIDGDGAAMVRSACGLGLEGVISKRRDRPYRSGRNGDWVKTKCTDRQEFVIGGYVPSAASRRAVGSLILGYMENGDLRHAGRSGTGFTAESARSLWAKLDAMARKTSPFAGRLSAEARRGAVWVEPTLVAEIEFRGWTGDRHLRHAAFKGLREDKAPDEVVVEGPAAPSPAAAAKPVRAKARGGGGEVAGVPLTNPGRLLWDEGITKQGLAEFYETIADWILPHLVGRPLSLVRCPSGAGHGCFFQKHSWAGLSDHIRRETLRDEDGEEEVLFVEDIQGIVALVQAGVLEIHPWGSTIADIERPDRIVMDLDPAEDVPWPQVIAAAHDVRARLDGVGLRSFVKSTGGKGLHVVVPLTPKAGWPEAKGFAQTLAAAMEADRPDLYLAKASKQARRGRIYVDYLRNGRGATAICAYSTRARPNAPVSVPLGWDELDPAVKPNHFTIANLPARLAGLRADPWEAIAAVQQVLPAVGGRSSKSRPPRTRPRT